MARKIFPIILILAFSFGSAKLSSALFSCNGKPSCCSAAGNLPCCNPKQVPSPPKHSVPYDHPKSCSCELKKETASDSRDLAQQPRELAKTWKKLKFVSSTFPNILMIEKIKAQEESSSPPSRYQILSIQDSPLRC